LPIGRISGCLKECEKIIHFGELKKNDVSIFP